GGFCRTAPSIERHPGSRVQTKSVGARGGRVFGPFTGVNLGKLAENIQPDSSQTYCWELWLRAGGFCRTLASIERPLECRVQGSAWELEAAEFLDLSQ